MSVAEHHMILELEATAQTLFRLWRDEGWGTWLETQSLLQAQQVRGDAIMARPADLMGRHREGK